MKRILTTALVSLALFCGACSTPSVENYAGTSPELDPIKFFDGEVRAWGMVQDSSGQVTRRFKADYSGQRTGDTVVVNERTTYTDGEVEERTWTFKRSGEHSYTGETADLVGVAQASVHGHALNWNYVFKVRTKDKTWELDFDDWMYQIDDNVILNRVTMRKFGLRVGELTVTFQRVQ